MLNLSLSVRYGIFFRPLPVMAYLLKNKQKAPPHRPYRRSERSFAIQTAHASAEEAHTQQLLAFTQSNRSIGPSSPQLGLPVPIITGFTGKSSIFPTFFGNNFSGRKMLMQIAIFSWKQRSFFVFLRKCRGFCHFRVAFPVLLHYNRQVF